ncbi:protein fantom [Corythoichthys intestinalis]|uniref:protein fantom n=1 Tax=Corythoichthys intestinalis TaxID=161448 RepID=UPI0025A61CC6|nr:protein fantom [Corythoichthys intestinalis]
MSPMVDETAGDLPVRDVGLMRGGLMPTLPDSISEVKPWKKHHIMISKDPQRLFRLPREHLEDLCLHVQEENVVLRKHSRAQEQKMRRMSTRLMRLRQTCPSSGSAKEKDMEDTLQELETRVATLESQKAALHNKLSLAKQQILDLGSRTPYKFSKGKSTEVEVGVRRATHTAPPRYCPTMEDNKVVTDKFVGEQMRVMELELTARTLRDTLRDKEKEIEGTVREMKRQQAERHRINIRENVDVICLQKQLSEKSASLRVTQEKLADLQQAYENQLEESQRSLRESQTLLLEKVEELNEQLKQERDRALKLEAQSMSVNLPLQNLNELQDRIRDLEGERDRIKENYDSLLESTFTNYSNRDSHIDKHRDVDEEPENEVCKKDSNILARTLENEREAKGRLETEMEKLIKEKEMLEEHHNDKLHHLEEEVLQYKEQISCLQTRLDSVTKEFDLTDEELSETLLQIKAFRMQQENREGLRFLGPDGENGHPELTKIQASHAETVLELQKTRRLLLLEHHISKDLQGELDTVKKRLELERQEVMKSVAEKNKVLSKRALQINTLQAQLKALAYSKKNHKGTMPIQYTWPAGNQEVAQPFEDDISCAPLRLGESLLELHIKVATFTPGGLQNMDNFQVGQAEDIVTFCTYSLLDFEVHSTPLVAGSQPNYDFNSHYALTAHDLARLRVQGSRVRVELHQALGGVRFVTHGSGHLSLIGAMDRIGERTNGCVNITGPEGEIVGVVDFWVRLFPPAEPKEGILARDSEGIAATKTIPTHLTLGWGEGDHTQELYDYGSGVPNEVLLLLEHCEGLSGRWPGLLPDAYLTYRLYDLQPHVSKTIRGTADPIFHDTASYPLAVTADVLRYLRSSSLWVYVFDESDDQIPPAYLAKTPIPLRALSTGKEITGDYVLRDPAGGPRGKVRVLIKWKYPFQPLADAMGNRERRRDEEKVSQRPIAKPRVKTQQLLAGEPKTRQKNAKAYPTSDYMKTVTTKRSDERSAGLYGKGPPIRSSESQTKSSENSSRESLLRKSSATKAATHSIPSVDVVSVDEVEELEEEKKEDGSKSGIEEPSESSDTSTSDLLIIPSKRKTRTGNKLRVEILSLTFEPSSCVALDNSVQRVYVEYRLLGVPMETTETPMSLRKPTKGEEIHYNFTRVIYVDGSLSAPLRQYLYTMLEGSDPNKRWLKFTIVSEPMDDSEECADVGYAFLDLQELLLTGNDVFEQQIAIVRVDEDQEVIGFLKVSLEAATALSCIYKEFHLPDDTEDDSENEEEEEEEEEEQQT